VLFEVIGVQLDQPRQQVIAVQILRLRQVADAGFDLTDQAVTQTPRCR
jgi:hypothetical protein